MSSIAAAGLSNVRVLERNAERLPLPDPSVDVVTSNGVVNLVPDRGNDFRGTSGQLARRSGMDTTSTIDVDGLTWGGLEPLTAQHVRSLAPGDVLEVRSDRSEAGDGIRAWVALTGYTLVGF